MNSQHIAPGLEPLTYAGQPRGPSGGNRRSAHADPPLLLSEFMTLTPQTSSRDGREGCETTSPPVLTRPMNLRQSIRVAAWNVNTLSEPGYQVAMQNILAAHDIDIACLSECRITGNGMTKIGSHTLIYSGGRTKHNGVALFLSPYIAQNLVSWRAVSDRLLLARFKHRHGSLTVISVYAPTNSPKNKPNKELFYNALDDLIAHVPPHDKLVVAGDFNAVSGTDRRDLETIIGPFGSGNRNENSDSLISLCASHKLTIVGSWFRRRNIHRWTHVSRHLNEENKLKREIDHFLLRDRNDAIQLRVMRGIEAPSNTDHYLVLLRFRIAFPFSAPRSKTKRIDSHRLFHDLSTRNAFRLELTNRFSVLSTLEDETDPNVLCKSITDTILIAAGKTAAGTSRPHKPWLSEASLDLISQKRNAALRGDAVLRTALQKRFKESAIRDKEVFLDSIASQAEEANRKNDTKGIFRAIRIISGKHKRDPLPNVNKSDGSPCFTAEEALDTWQRHFNNALNHPPSLSPWSSPRPPESADPIPSPDEASIRKAISKLKLGRSSGPDSISPEMLCASSDIISPFLYKLFNAVWHTGKIPQIWKDATIIPVYKGKGCKQTCSNYRPISLLSVIGKLFASIILNITQGYFLDSRLPQQSGFTPGRSTCDAILSLRILADIHRLFKRPLYVAYIDFKAAFDSVDRSALWSALSTLNLPGPLLELVRELHNGTSSRILVNGQLSPSFNSLSGVRQGCVLAPSLFCLVMDVVLRSTRPTGINICDFTFSDSAYADDAAFVDSSVESLCGSLQRLQVEGAKFGLNISWSKTKIQDLSTDDPLDPVSIDGNPVDSVTEFRYLGSTLETGSGSHNEIVRRIALAGSVLNSLASVWRQKRLSLGLKLRLFNALVVSVLLYGSETWIILQADANRLHGFYMQCQRRILGIRWYQLISNEAVTSMTCLPPITDVIRKRRLALFGHVARLSPEVPANKALCAGIDILSKTAIPDGWRRPVGRPCKTWLDQVKEDMSPWSWPDILACAMDRSSWRWEVAMACGYAYD